MNIGVDDVCDTGLVLGLGRWEPTPISLKPSSSNPNLLEPSLTLGISDNSSMASAAAQSQSPVNTIYSSIRIKRENNTVSEETEMGFSSRTISDEEEEGCVRKKLRLTKEQSALLEDKFREHTTVHPKQKLALAKQLNLRPRQVEVWFQNRRARTKLKQTEVDREALKRCFEKLSDENRRLQRELEELRALKVGPTPPVYSQAAAIAVCPSCKRVIGPAVLGAEAGKAGTFIIATTKARFLSPFSQPAAC